MEAKKYPLWEVRIRLEKGMGLYSGEKITSADRAVEVMQRELSGYDREVVCIVNLNISIFFCHASYGYWQKDVLEEFQGILQGERILLAGHNLQFDLCFLRCAMEQERKEDILSLVNAADYLDTLTVYKDLRPSPHKLSAAMQEYGYPVLGEHNALVDAGALLCLTCVMGDEREDLSSYINRFGIDPRYGLFGSEIEKVVYFSQDGTKPPVVAKPHHKSR